MQKLSKLLKKQITATIIAIFFGFLVAGIILAATGYNPLQTFIVLFNGMLSKPKYVMNVIAKATPIILTAVSVSFAFKVGLFNIGAEGQFIMGTIAAAVVGILFDFPAIIQYPLVILSGVVVGGLYGAIVGYLKAKHGIHEVITSIMFNWIAFYASNYVVATERFHKSNSTSTLTINETGIDAIYRWKKSTAGQATLKESSFLLETIGKTDINLGIIFAIAVAIIVAILLKRTTKGFELRAVGFNQDAAQAAGINVKKNIIHAMLISGAISGLAGSLFVAGVSQKISTLGMFENYGFNGLSVALIAGNSPVGSIFAGLLFSGLSFGGRAIQSQIGAPSEIIDIMIGTIVFFVALTKIIPVLVDRFIKEGESNGK